MNLRFELPTLMRFAFCRLTKFKEQFWSFTEHRDGKRVNRTREKTKTGKQQLEGASATTISGVGDGPQNVPSVLFAVGSRIRRLGFS